MPKYKHCSHYEGCCPCLDCKIPCSYSCVRETEIAVDTDKLCDKAKRYCESGREKDERSDSQGRCPGSN